MSPKISDDQMITDFVTGDYRPNIGAEGNRQAVERFLVNEKGYSKTDIQVDCPIVLDMDGETYTSTLDLVVHVNQQPFMVIKCAPGSLASREREVISAARLLADYQIPLSVSSDGVTAIAWDTMTGEQLSEGLGSIPSKSQADEMMQNVTLKPLPDKKRRQQLLIFRSYDSMNVNKPNRLKSGNDS